MITQATFLGPQMEYKVATALTIAGDTATLTVRQQNTASASIQEAGEMTGATDGDDIERHAFRPGERIILAWRPEASLILQEVGAKSDAAMSGEGRAESTSAHSPQASSV
jgi:hypothetical protein